MNKEHFKLLKHCSDNKDLSAWNKFRNKKPNINIDLRFSSLNNFYLKNANLTNIDFRYVDISNSNMEYSDFKNSQIIRFIDYIAIYFYFFILSSAIVYFFNITIGEFKDINIINDIEIDKKYINFVASSMIINGFLLVFPFFLNLIGLREQRDTRYIKILKVTVGFIFFAAMIFYVYSIFTSIVETSMLLIFASFMPSAIIFFEFRQGQIEALKSAKNINKVFYLNENDGIDIIDAKIEKTKIKINEIEKDKNLLNKEEVRELKDTLSVLLHQLNVEKDLREIAVTEEKLRQIEERKVEESMAKIKKSFSHITKIEESLNGLNNVYVLLLLIGLLMLGYFGYLSFEHREAYFSKLNSITLSSSLGIVIFYATPILFSFFIIIFSILKMKENIQDKEKLLEKKYLIELIESTFYAQIAIGGNAKQSLQKLIDKLSDSAFSQLINEKIESKNPIKEKNNVNYKNTLSQKRMDMLIQSVLKKI